MFSSATIQIKDTQALSKDDIRQKVWKYFKENDLAATCPLSVFKRIPNFTGADEAGGKLAELKCFKKANFVKVNLDKPQGEVRFLTLEAGKVLLVPTPGLRSGLFNRMENTSAGENTPENLRLLAQNDGMKRFSQSLQLDDAAKVDLVVVGSVAVSKSGHRIGKGAGFDDLEYGMMRHMKCVSEETLIVTTVHDCQVFDDLPARLFGTHDVPVDVIVTPTQVINVPRTHKRPPGILWNLINPEKFFRVAILRTLYQRQKDGGEDVTLASNQPVPTKEDIAEYWENVEAEREAREEAKAANKERHAARQRRASGVMREHACINVPVNINHHNHMMRRSDGEVAGRRDRDRLRYIDRCSRGYFGTPPSFSLYLGNVPPHARTREIVEALKDRIGEKAHGVDIQRRTEAGYAFLRFSRLDPEFADHHVNALQGLRVSGQEVVIGRFRDRRVGGP